MIQFECPRVIHPLVSFTFGVNSGLPFSLDAGKGKCCMWPFKKVEIHYAKIGFGDSKCANSNSPGSYTPWCHSLLESTEGCPFLWMQEKRKAACGLLIKWKSIMQNGFLGLQKIQFECPRVIHTLVPFSFGVHWGVPFSLDAGKGKCCMWPVNKVKINLEIWVSWTANGPIRMPQGHTPLGVIHFWGPLWGALSSACRKRKMLHVAC